jgi:hypothetical protein
VTLVLDGDGERRDERAHDATAVRGAVQRGS